MTALCGFAIVCLAIVVSACREPTLECLKAVSIEIHMSAKEITTLLGHLCSKQTRSYLEFGCGGSTLLAGFCNVSEIVSLDNSLDWLTRVREHSIWHASKANLQQLYVNMGELNAWGTPINNESSAAFMHYSHAVLQYTHKPFDVILIDGRFRIACALIALQRAHSSSIILIHDYNRNIYHVLESVLQKIKVTETLSQFAFPQTIDVVAISQLLKKYLYHLNK